MEDLDQSDSELDESDNESFIYESEEEDSSDFWSESESGTDSDEPVRVKSKRGRPPKPIDDLGNFGFGVLRRKINQG